jgi:ABC-2 type transport system ATP-binding protein
MDNNQSERLAIKTENLSKKFDQLVAVSRVNLNIQPGEIYALIGPNGAGKTTLIKIIVGLLSADTGCASIFGHDINKESEEAKKFFGYISDNPTAYDYLTGREFLVLTGSLRMMEKQKIIKCINELVHLFPISDVIDQPMSEYSRGNKQKVAFLAALLAEPKLIIIDEPIVGLDPDSIKIFGKTLKNFAKKGGTVFFATHILSFAQLYADRVGIMAKGRIQLEKNIGKEEKLEKLYQSYS